MPSSAPFGTAVAASSEAIVTVFVDDAHLPWRGRRWSHMVANSAEELHLAAEALGLRREYARDRGRTLHYDLPAEWRQRAIEQGLAEPISWRALVQRRATIAAGRRGRSAPAPPG
jgi:uncharacterized membrane protein